MTFAPLHMDPPKCCRCEKTPGELAEYVEASQPENYGRAISPDEYVRREEGTYNPHTNAFACTPCYAALGCPTTRRGWKAPKSWKETVL